MEQIPLVLEKRTALGKKVKALRRQGIAPVHLYGPGIASQALQAPAPELFKAITRAGRTTPLQVTVKGEEQGHVAFVREVQWHPLRGDLLHVDLMQVELTQRMRAEVPIHLVGEAPALKEYRGTVVQLAFSVEVEALPLEMPHRIEADLSVLTEPDRVLRNRDLPLPEGVTLLPDEDDVVARIELVREEVPAPQEVPAEGVPEAPAQAPEAGGEAEQEERS